ncbi:MAG: hypothetical protein COW84_00825 [Gammaproteobacteria bacterium CG22_combo_CG10-13_8_21_14_all_40_8]|nr:MAG: hypothetical protein COW84_00825 [Gammaproteobacteria bacterium CG22_combo_CG10-13_8_21_14_all_40_8]
MTSERREFYRIEDEIVVNFSHVNPHSTLPNLDELEKQLPVSFQLIQELQGIKWEAKQSLQPIDKKPEVQSYLSKLDKRIQLAGEIAMRQYLSEHAARRAVSISGNGLRVVVDSPLKMDSLVMVELILPESIAAILCYAKVVKCTPLEQQYDLVVTFERIREVDRDAIIGHIMRQESKILRNHKVV